MRLAISDLGRLKARAFDVGGTVLDWHGGIVEGYQTAFIRRPTEWGSDDAPEPQPDPSLDLVADGLDDLAASWRLSARPPWAGRVVQPGNVTSFVSGETAHRCPGFGFHG